MATFTFVPAIVPSEVSCDPSPATGFAALLGAALAGTYMLSPRPACDELSLIAVVNQKLKDVLGSGANFKVSSCERKDCLQIELGIDCFSGMPRAERECLLANMLEGVVEDKLTEIQIIWRQPSADELSRCDAEVHFPAQSCGASHADTSTEIDSDSAEGECEDACTASISSTCSYDDPSDNSCCGGRDVFDDAQVSSCVLQQTAAARCESTQVGSIEPTATTAKAAGLPDGTAVCSGLVAARRQQLLARGPQFRPADTWVIRQGIVPELRKQWTKDDLDD